MDLVAIIAPVPQVVHPNFHHLDIAVGGGERIAGKQRGRDRNGESPVAQPEIVVLELQRPMRRERPFKASADQPAASDVVVAIAEAGQGRAAEIHAGRKVRDAQAVVADPAAAGLAVEQQFIEGIAEAGGQGRDPAIVVGDRNGANVWNDHPIAGVGAGPVGVPFATDDEVADLVIGADLPAGQEGGVVAVVEVGQEDGVRPIVLGPGAANIDADVEAGPIQHGHRRWQRRRGPDRQIRRAGDGRAKREKGDACDQCLKFHRVPSSLSTTPRLTADRRADGLLVLSRGPPFNCDPSATLKTFRTGGRAEPVPAPDQQIRPSNRFAT